MVFDQLVCADKTRLTPEGIAQLQEFSRAGVRCYPDDPATEGEVLARIADADSILVGSQTQVSAALLRAAGRLRYVGMCCSLYDPASANVDIVAARELGIQVQGVHRFRSNYAQNVYEELKESGKNDREARREVSRRLGHNRVQVTNSYIPAQVPNDRF